MLSEAQLPHFWPAGAPLTWLLCPLSMVLVVTDSFHGTWGGAGERLPLPSTFLAGPEN